MCLCRTGGVSVNHLYGVFVRTGSGPDVIIEDITNTLDNTDKRVIWSFLSLPLLKLYFRIIMAQIWTCCMTQRLVSLVYSPVYPTV